MSGGGGDVGRKNYEERPVKEVFERVKGGYTILNGYEKEKGDMGNW